MRPRFARIQTSGASGSGTTTLGDAVARKLGAKHFDVDDYCWAPTEPPFIQRREPLSAD